MYFPFVPQGAWTALVTPFDASGKLDRTALASLIEFQFEQGIQGVVPAGTTGESPTLSWDEHIAVIEETVKAAGGRIGVLAGTGSNSTEEAISATGHARQAGASAALLVDCYYNGPSSLELRAEYYGRILDAVPEIPLVPYIIPGRTGAALAAADLAILHRNNQKRMPAVKEATGDLERMREDRRLGGPTLAILSGDDDLTLTMMNDPAIGCAGVISVMSNLCPGALVKMVQAAASRRADLANRIAQTLTPLFKLVTFSVEATRAIPSGPTVSLKDKYRNPVPVKTMMAALGMPVGAVRPPLGKMDPAAVAVCRKVLLDLHRTRPEYLQPIAKAFKVDIEKRLNDEGVWAGLTRK